MCETFHLQFTPETGIVAWADDAIYEQFSGQAMKKGHFWKILLGRRINLDEDDHDGSQFLEGLLEDVLFFPLPWNMEHPEPWETVLESDGVWVTRPCFSTDSDGDNDSAKGKNENDNHLEGTQRDWSYYIREVHYDMEPVCHSDDYEELSDNGDGESEDSERDPGWASRAGVQDSEYYLSSGDEGGEVETDDLQEEPWTDEIASDESDEEAGNGFNSTKSWGGEVVCPSLTMTD
jgi:hypothetical protein